MHYNTTTNSRFMHAQTNSIMQNNLNGILAEVSNLLKQKLDVLFAELLTKSDEYDETNRILLTLPIIKNIINKSTVAPIVNTNESKPKPLFEQTCTFNYDSLLLFEKEPGQTIETTDMSEHACAHTITIDEVTRQPPETSEPIIENISLNIEEVESVHDNLDEEEVVEVEEDNDDEEEEEDDDEEEEDEQAEDDEDNHEQEEDTCTKDTNINTLQRELVECVDTIATQSDDAQEEEVVEEEANDEEVVEEVEEDDQDEIETIATQSCADEEEEKDDEDLEDGDGEEEEEEENEEVFEITIKNKTYFTTSETNGIIYESDANGDPGDEIGVFKNGVPHFN